MLLNWNATSRPFILILNIKEMSLLLESLIVFGGSCALCMIVVWAVKILYDYEK